MPQDYMFMAIKIQHIGLVVIYNFVPYVVDKIHEGLINLKKGGKNHFYWYSLLMHMFLFKDVDYFGQFMTLNRVVDGGSMPVQAWSTIMSKDWVAASYLLFDNCFASRLKTRLTINPPTIPKQFLDFLRPKERIPKLNIEHNWGDVIPYSVRTVLRVYGYSGKPYVLPYNITLRLGFAKVMRQIAWIQERIDREK